MAVLADYKTLRKNFNQRVSGKLALPETAADGTQILAENGSIKLELTVKDGNVEKIVIHSAKAETPEFDESFQGFEGGLGISNIKLFYVYQEFVRKQSTTTAVSKQVKVTYVTKSPSDLTAIFESE